MASRSSGPVSVAVLLLVCLLSPPTAAGEGLDLRSWLDRPGTRLVAVEFYATWCKPCMAAVPRWKALHERYRSRGLRLIVVATQDPEGQCMNPGWNPDDVVCDPEGDLARALNVGPRLPAAFLWSWQGNLLVRQGHVDEVERAVESALRRTPRVVIQARNARGNASKSLRHLLRDELSSCGKLDVVASEDERAALREIKAAGHALGMDDRLACEVGREVSANSLLKASVGGPKGKRRLYLTLFSAESACLLAAATAPWSRKQAARVVAEAVHKLLGRLRTGLEMPGAPRRVERPGSGERPAVPEETPQAVAPEAHVPEVVDRGPAVVELPAVEVPGPVVVPSEPPEPRPGEAGGGPRWSVLAPLGAGVALLAGGAVFGVLADRAEAELVAGEAEVITMAEIQEDHERATSLAMTANVLYAAGGVAFAVGTAVWLLTDGDTAGEAALRVVPAGSGGLGLAGGGTF